MIVSSENSSDIVMGGEYYKHQEDALHGHERGKQPGGTLEGLKSRIEVSTLLAAQSCDPMATSRRQQTQVSLSSLVVFSICLPPCVMRARYVPAFFQPSRLSIHDTNTVPSAATVSPSKECEIQTCLRALVSAAELLASSSTRTHTQTTGTAGNRPIPASLAG